MPNGIQPRPCGGPMNYRRRLRIMLAALAALTGAAMLFNFVVNPYGAWRHRLVSQIYYREREGHDRIIAPYMLQSTEPNTVLVGASRVLMGMPIDQGLKDGILNAAMAAALPEEIGRVMEVALRNPHLKRVIWGLEFFSFDARLIGNPETYARLNRNLRLLVLDNLLSAEALDYGSHLLLRAFEGRSHLDLQVREPIPWPEDYICERFVRHPERGMVATGEPGALRQITLETPYHQNANCCDEVMHNFAKTVDQIRRRRVEPIIFVPPLSEYELEAIRQNGVWPVFQQWKRDLTRILPYYWDFSGYTRLARTDTMFLDVLHVKPEVGMTILRRLLGKPDSGCAQMGVVVDAGLRVDSHNIDQVLALQDQGEQAANAEPNKYLAVVSRAITQHEKLASR
jgi:hypothetical protein